MQTAVPQSIYRNSLDVAILITILDYRIKEVHWPLGPHNYNAKAVEAHIVNMCKYFKISGAMRGVCRYQ